jgi:hypothetical protein
MLHITFIEKNVILFQHQQSADSRSLETLFSHGLNVTFHPRNNQISNNYPFGSHCQNKLDGILANYQNGQRNFDWEMYGDHP